MKRERTAAAWWQLCVLCHGLKGVLCRVRGNKNDDKRRRKRKAKYQQQHVMAGAPMRKSVPFQTPASPTHSLQQPMSVILVRLMNIP
jgi:hypothetical protein